MRDQNIKPDQILKGSLDFISVFSDPGCDTAGSVYGCLILVKKSDYLLMDL
jgi:hypothetical protein